jgi:hypothetical protein
MLAQRSEFPLEEPQAALERAFIDEYLRVHGHDIGMLYRLPSDQVQSVLREAALYAAARLAELEARARYVHEIHGATLKSGS